MRVRRTSERGRVALEMGASDERLMEKVAAGKFALKRLLVPVDFSRHSEKALQYALAFAGQFGAELTLLHVVEPMVYPENYVAIPPADDDINQNLLQSASNRLTRLQAAAAGQKVTANTLARLGRPYIEITEVAREMEADLIILATHGYTGLKHVLLGSTAERVVRHAPCPVLTVRIPERDFVKGE